MNIFRQFEYNHKEKNKPTWPLTLNQVNNETTDSLHTARSNYCADEVIGFVCIVTRTTALYELKHVFVA